MGKIVPNRRVNISVIMPCMFPTFIFCLLFTTMDGVLSSAAVRVVFDVGGGRVGESDTRRNINGRRSVYVKLTCAFLAVRWQRATTSAGVLFLKPLDTNTPSKNVNISVFAE